MVWIIWGYIFMMPFWLWIQRHVRSFLVIILLLMIVACLTSLWWRSCHLRTPTSILHFTSTSRRDFFLKTCRFTLLWTNNIFSNLDCSVRQSVKELYVTIKVLLLMLIQHQSSSFSRSTSTSTGSALLASKGFFRPSKGHRFTFW